MKKITLILGITIYLLMLLSCKMEDEPTEPDAGISVTLTDTPASQTDSRAISILVGGNDIVEYIYKLDNADWPEPAVFIPTSVRITADKLEEGVHTLCVKGRTSDGKESKVKCITWTVQFKWKVILSDLPEQKTQETNVNIAVGGRNITAYKYKCHLEGELTDFSDEKTLAKRIVLTDLLPGKYVLTVIGKTTDNVWLEDPEEVIDYGAIYSWEIDFEPPAPTFSNLPFLYSRMTSIDIAINNPDVVAYKYKLDSDVTFSAETPSTAHIVRGNLAEGLHSLTVIAVDALGNWQSETEATTYNWTIDKNYNPPLLLLNAPNQLSNATSLDIAMIKTSELTTDDLAGYKYKINSGSWSQEQDINFHLIGSGLNEGTNRLTLRFKDIKGNYYTDYDYVWVVDTTPPVVNVGSDISWRNEPVNLFAFVSDLYPCTYLWEKADTYEGAIHFSEPTGLTTTVAGEDNQEAGYVVKLTATDAAGNKGTDTLIFNWDKRGPRVKSGLDAIATRVPVTVSPVLEDCNAITCIWEKTFGSGTLVFSTTTGPVTTISSLVDGAYTINLQTKDTLGNTNNTAFSFTWDTVAPPPVSNLSSIFYPIGARLEWQNPSITDLAGVLILAATEAVNANIEHGIRYLKDDEVGNATVVLAENGEMGIIDLKSEQQYFFKVYAYDKAYNYSSAVTCSGVTPELIVYVSKAGDNNNSGLHPTEPKKTIQAGVNVVYNAESRGKVYVSAGTYNENLVLRGQASLYGSFSADWSVRNNLDRENVNFKTEICSNTSRGIVADDLSADARLDGFVITGLSSTDKGISLLRSSLVISYNTFRISGKYGIYNELSSPEIFSNIIEMQAGVEKCALYNSQSSPHIYNNVINGGIGTETNTYGIYNENLSAPVIINNTICGGQAKIGSYGIYITGSPGIKIENNIIFTSPSYYQFGIYEYYKDNPLTFRNNNVFDCLVLYHNGDEGDIVLLEGINRLADVSSGGNISVDPQFQDRAANNFRLTEASGVNVRAGGLDLSALINMDILGQPRTNTYTGQGLVDPTNTGASGWSMGAYEQD